MTAVPQERSRTAEAKLLETTAQLEELQVKQRQLEARNLLLEKVARRNKQTGLREAHEPVPLPWEVGQVASLQALVFYSAAYSISDVLPMPAQLLTQAIMHLKDDDVYLDCGTGQAKLSAGGKRLVLTVWSDKTQLLTVEQASQLTLPEFGRLWKVRAMLQDALLLISPAAICSIQGVPHL